MNPPPDIHYIDVAPWCGLREPFSSLSHLLGAAVFAGLGYHLIRRGRGDWVRTASLSVLVAASVELLITSGIYHMYEPGPVRKVMLRLDVASVFLLIAGSMTPVHAILFKGRSRQVGLVLVWTVAITGIIWRVLFCQDTPGPEGIAFFLLFGWGSATTAVVLWRRFGWTFIRPAVFSGLAYTAGAIGLVLNRPILVPGIIGPHEVWHIAVLTALGLQWRFVYQFASGDPRYITEK